MFSPQTIELKWAGECEEFNLTESVKKQNKTAYSINLNSSADLSYAHMRAADLMDSG